MKIYIPLRVLVVVVVDIAHLCALLSDFASQTRNPPKPATARYEDSPVCPK
jgi:hypothetical protein